MASIQFHRTRRGVLAHFAADQCIGQSLHRYGEWAEEEIALLRPYLPEGGTALDVGANVGVHTLAFAQCVGPAGRVIAIEGQPSAFALLAHNIVANGLMDTVTALPLLAGTGAALVPHTIAPITDNVGAKSFFRDVHGRDIHDDAASAGRRDVTPGVSIKLALVPVDSLGLTACDLMKIDVEGMELDVLKGARDVLHRLRPVVYFEHAAGGIDEIFHLFREAGYRLFWHRANPFNRLNFKGDTHNIFGGNTELNVLALPEGASPPAGLLELTDPTQPPPHMSEAEGLPGVAVEAG